MVQNPGFQFRRYCRTCGSDGVRGWRHGIRRAHKVTIDLAVTVQESVKRHNGLGSHRHNLIVCETRDGFHASFGAGVTPAPSDKKEKMRDFVPVRTFLVSLLSEAKNPASSQPRPSKLLATTSRAA